MFKRDYILRLVEQLAETLARIAGLRKEGRFDQAEAALDEAYALFGMPRRMLDALDVPSLAAVLADDAKIDAAARLLEEEALLLDARGGPGDFVRAARRRNRARDLVAASGRRSL